MENPSGWSPVTKAIHEILVQHQNYGNPSSQFVAMELSQELYFRGLIPKGVDLKSVVTEFETIIHRHYLPEMKMICGLSLPSKLSNKLTELLPPT